ncbi:hypothetical protein [Mesobacillus foraminis]|uniref:Mce-associated membrane protein n=1 Tax=Mesobacillus foraminis TaxID=279826 RepID=A0A4V2RBU9_9BACI|nr:hypothetical protein [Mesobacillus foraminis]TCN18450.1 hypothetical protein EV146_12049 [Mesobacillus foraminis]
MNKVAVSLLGLSILANIFLGFMYVGQKTIATQVEAKQRETQDQMEQVREDAKKRAQELDTFQQNEALYAIEQSDEVKGFVEETFKRLFHYDNKSYVERFDGVRDRLSESVISKLSASGENGSTQIEFKNEVKAVSVYLSALDIDRAKALVNMETQYSVGGSEFPRRHQMYEVTLSREGEEWLVDKLEMMGAFEPFEES